LADALADGDAPGLLLAGPPALFAGLAELLQAVARAITPTTSTPGNLCIRRG
jgi:hypothetical protein